jgi:hypothetical protein
MIFKNFKQRSVSKKTYFCAAIKIFRNKLKTERNEETVHYVGSGMLSDVHRLQQQAC